MVSAQETWKERRVNNKILRARMVMMTENCRGSDDVNLLKLCCEMFLLQFEYFPKAFDQSRDC